MIAHSEKTTLREHEGVVQAGLAPLSAPRRQQLPPTQPFQHVFDLDGQEVPLCI